ncbi:hypothetical protein AIIMSPlu_037 [Pseudomonas phage AIIMS-Plu-RaNi]|nr:hypothetical protein AIIMSPlu_037 [Pseudomonas phage AIIMS-Plu-RaNi]
MTRTAAFCTDRANTAFEAGFTSKAAKQAALGDITRAYELLRAEITSLVLDTAHDERTEAHDDVYWNLPAYPHQWKAKHRTLSLSVFPQTEAVCDQIEELVAFRAAVKDAEVVKVERQADERVERVQKSIRETMEQRQADYARGLDLSKLFGGLSVTANVHLVINQHGTTFLRAFYFMHGRMTALGVILAVAQTLAEEAK